MDNKGHVIDNLMNISAEREAWFVKTSYVYIYVCVYMLVRRHIYM